MCYHCTTPPHVASSHTNNGEGSALELLKETTITLGSFTSHISDRTVFVVNVGLKTIERKLALKFSRPLWSNLAGNAKKR